MKRVYVIPPDAKRIVLDEQNQRLPYVGRMVNRTPFIIRRIKQGDMFVLDTDEKIGAHQTKCAVAAKKMSGEAAEVVEESSQKAAAETAKKVTGKGGAR